MNLRDVRMVERGERLGFALEPHEAIGIVGKRLRKNLQRDITRELRVPGPVHFAHTARAERGSDFVGAHAGPGDSLMSVRPGFYPTLHLSAGTSIHTFATVVNDVE